MLSLPRKLARVCVYNSSFAARTFSAYYEPGVPLVKPPQAKPCSYNPDLKKILEEIDSEWTPEKFEEEARNHVGMTWAPFGPARDGAMRVERGDGVYIVLNNGQRVMDFNSMAMCSNLGHTVPPEIIDGIVEQLNVMPYMYPGVSIGQTRIKLSELLAHIMPGDLNTFLYPSTGMEANETAVRLARRFTGRQKVLTMYRSYHGSSSMTLTMTGDQRRWPVEGQATGHVHAFDPYPYGFKLGETDEEVCSMALSMLREQIVAEGPSTFACIVLEGVTGTNGVFMRPPGYMEGVRAMCDEFGILLVCDEVMAGFGRTGRWFGFQHSSAQPDLVTCAKGLTAAFLPLGCVAMTDRVAAFFTENPTAIGSTYNAHPGPLACSLGVLRYMIEHDVVGNVARLEGVMRKRLEALKAKHACVKQVRNVGLFGGFDVQKNKRGDFHALVHEPLTPAMLAFKAELLKSGLFTMMRGHQVFTNPPLIITEEELNKGFDIIDGALHVLDDAMED